MINNHHIRGAKLRERQRESSSLILQDRVREQPRAIDAWYVRRSAGVQMIRCLNVWK